MVFTPLANKAQASTGSRNRFGANVDVLEPLEQIEFRRDLVSDGAMRGAIAYIRRWKRGNTNQLGSVSTGNFSLTPEELGQQQVLTRDLYETVLPPQFRFTTPPTSNFTTRPAAISAITPSVNAAPLATTSGPVPLQVVPFGSQAPPPSTSGGVRSANPSGTSTAPLASPDGGLASVGSDAMWQFLFNPSELELEAGPEFKSAEVWAVSDKANSGQPLHWSYNKNAQLKFNSIVLNGYMFGKKVDKLQAGLLELFMSRDGEGQDGPAVLEFVWGSRVFGPCVIKNIAIKEKMWDGGRVVNAELSFTLEQVPEWTINDGFVDVARPGRLPVTNAESLPTAAGGNSGNAAKCKNLPNISTNLRALRSLSNDNSLNKFDKYKSIYKQLQGSLIKPLEGTTYEPDNLKSRTPRASLSEAINLASDALRNNISQVQLKSPECTGGAS